MAAYFKGGQPMKSIGPHLITQPLDRKDVNGRFMVTCKVCGTTAHAYKLEEAEADLSIIVCNPNCPNCKNLRNSCSTRPAVPMGGDCNTVLHQCPRDGNRWWQGNTYFHLWQQVTSEREWESLNRDLTRSHAGNDYDEW